MNIPDFPIFKLIFQTFSNFLKNWDFSMLSNFQETLALFKFGQLMHLWMNFVLLEFKVLYFMKEAGWKWWWNRPSRGVQEQNYSKAEDLPDLHQWNICHRDMKLENILLMSNYQDSLLHRFGIQWTLTLVQFLSL